MKRREAIKGIGMSLGFVVATPTVISILQSCKTDPKEEWLPLFFTKEQANVIQQVVGLMLPATNALPGAKDVNVPQFIDKYASLVASEEDKNQFQKGLEAIVSATGKPVGEATDEDYDIVLKKYLKATPEEMEAFQNNEQEQIAFQSLMQLRGMSIWGYKNSKQVGMEVLVYDPIPGEFKGCISLEEATGGRLWSL